jgi:hypothetical protein
VQVSSSLTPFLSGFVAAALVGCTLAPHEPSEAAARASIVGMTPRQVASCMGRPGTQFREGDVVSWSYSTRGGSGPYVANQIPTSTQFDYSEFSGGLPSNSFNNALLPPPRPACTVQIIFDRGRVSAVSFQARDGEAHLYAQQCEAIVAPCVRQR